MTFIIRPAREDDLQTIYEMAKLTGGGFTNLPPDRDSLAAKLERTRKALARSRYLFIKQHRARFDEKILAELRGVIDDAGGSPFWDGLAGRFFGMSFQEADEFNAVNGHQFIADLMPKTPIYIDMLTDSARAVIGLPHPTGRAAMRMLEKEGFENSGYIDIFDGGPTLVGQIDSLKSVANARKVQFTGTHDARGEKILAATGQLIDFRCAFAQGVIHATDGTVQLDAQSAEALHLNPGDELLIVER